MKAEKVLTKEQCGRLFADVQRLAAFQAATQAVAAQAEQVRQALALQMDAYGIPQSVQSLEFDLPTLTVSWEVIPDGSGEPAADERCAPARPKRRRNSTN